MCFIKKAAVESDDGTEKEYKFREAWNGLSGTLSDDATLVVEDRTAYKLNAYSIAEGKTLTIDWTGMRDVLKPGHFRVSISTGANVLTVKFQNDYGDWYCIKSDNTIDFNTNTIELDTYSRYVIEFFDGHITAEKYNDPEILVSLDGTTTSYSVTYMVDEELTLSNTATSVSGSYECTITANEGYKIDTVTVLMAGMQVDAFDSETGTIKIDSVTGNISITAYATTA